MKKLQYSVTITFIVLMAAIFICSLFPDHDGFSSLENRKLSVRPELSLSSIFDGKFESGYESYLLDNFLLRDFSVQSYQTYTELFYLDAFKQSEAVLMSVDVDTFVSAQDPANADEAQTTDGQKAVGKAEKGKKTVDRQFSVQQDSTTAFELSDRQQSEDRKSTTEDTASSHQVRKGQDTADQSGGRLAGTASSEGQGGDVVPDNGHLTGVNQDSQKEQDTQNQSLQNQYIERYQGVQNPYAEQNQDAKNPYAEQNQDAKNPYAEQDQDAKNPHAEQDQDAKNPYAEQNQSVQNQYAGQNQDAQNQRAEQQDAQFQDTEQDQGDSRLNDSLIISGDRVMMPTGANNLKAYGSVLTKIAEALPGKNIYSITGPTSAAYFSSDKYSTGSYDQSRAEEIIKASVRGVKVVQAYDMLLRHKEENIYFRSDVHWTALGAYYAYSAFCRSAGLKPASLEKDFTMNIYKPFLGGLYSKIYKQPQAARLKNNPEQLDYYIPKTGYQLTLYNKGNLHAPNKVESIINTNFSSLGAYKYSCFAWGDQRIEKIDSDAPGGRKLLVVKDSYGSAFVPFLVPNYSKIYVIDPKGFNQKDSPDFDAKRLIRDEEIDDIVLCFSIYGSGRSIIQNALSDLFLKQR